MDQIHHIKYQYNLKGKSLRSISKETGHHFNTIRKYANKSDFNVVPKPRAARPYKLAPYTSIIDEWLEADLKIKPKQRHTAKRVYDRLKEEFKDFDVSDRAVRAYVSKKKKELGLKNEGYLPLCHPPGEAQVDFGEAQFIERGVLYDGHYLNVSFPYSNGGYLQLFKSANQECLLEGMKRIFHHIGKVPTASWFDNMSTAVTRIRKHGERDLSKGFERFVLHYGFQSNFCNPESGHEKGHVENKVGYHRRNLLVPIPEFDSIDQYNQMLLTRCDEDMFRDHYRLKKPIHVLFQEDLEAMESLPDFPFEVARYESVVADNYGKIRLEGKTYSASPNYAKQPLWIKIGAFTVEVLNANYECIARHERLYGDQNESMIWGPYLDLMSKRPTALKYTGFFHELPTTLQEYFHHCSYDQKKAGLNVLKEILTHNGMDVAIKTFRTSAEKNLKDADSLRALYKHLVNPSLPENPIALPSNLPEVSSFHADARVYDQLLLGGDSKWKQ